MLSAMVLTLPLLSIPQAESFGEDEAVEAAKRAVAEERGVSRGRLESYQVFAAQWRDSSLGCPQPGTAYLPVLTRGYRVFLRETDAPSRLYEVHVARGEAVVCEAADPDVGRTLPKAEAEWTARQLQHAPHMARLAREDLAGRLGVKTEEIVVSVTPRTWLDTSLGCPQEGETYDEMSVEGFLILLTVDEETYPYHADSESVFLCEEPTTEP